MNPEKKSGSAKAEDMPKEANISKNVLSRRKYHVYITKLEARWSPWWYLICAIVGLVFVLLPAVSAKWLDSIRELSVLYWIFDKFSGLGGPVIIIFIVYGVVSGLASAFAKDAYPGWDVREERGWPRAAEVMHRNLYPITRKGEIGFLSFSVMELLTPLSIVILLGVLAFFIRATSAHFE